MNPQKRQQGHIVQGPDDQLYVDGQTRTNVRIALSKLRNLPIEFGSYGLGFEDTIKSLEAAIGSPSPLSLAHYYELLAAVESTVADAMLKLSAMGPMDNTAVDIIATALVARRRAKCFEKFAEIPGRDREALDYLLDISDTRETIADSLAESREELLAGERAQIAENLRQTIDSLSKLDLNVTKPLEDVLSALMDVRRPLALGDYFGLAAQVAHVLTRLFIALSLGLGAEEGPQWLARASKQAAVKAACEFLVDYFDRPESETENATFLN